MKACYCNLCGTLVAEIELGKVRKDVILMCGKCRSKAKEAPDLFKTLFGGKK